MRNLIVTLLLVGMPALAEAQTIREQVLAGVSEEVVVADYPTLSLRGLTASAGAVVRVTVRNSDSFVSADGTSILTDYRVAVVDVIKETPGSHVNTGDVITIRRIGGVVNIEGRRVFSNEGGFPPFASGSEYVLFLKTDAGQPFEMLAGPQSAFLVHQGAVASLAASTKGPSIVPMPAFVSEVKEVSNRPNGTR